jgi:hypothetical protein
MSTCKQLAPAFPAAVTVAVMVILVFYAWLETKYGSGLRPHTAVIINT